MLLDKIMTAFQLAILAAPKVTMLVKLAHEYINTLLVAGLITREEQLKAHAHCDQLQADALAGIVPQSW